MLLLPLINLHYTDPCIRATPGLNMSTVTFVFCQHVIAFAERNFQESCNVNITVATYSQNWQPHKRTIVMSYGPC